MLKKLKRVFTNQKFYDIILLFYLITSDNIIPDRPYAKTIKDNYNRLKYNLGSVYDNCFKEISKDININLILDSSQEDGEVYRFH